MSVGKFVMTKSKAWSGITLKDHIGAIYGNKPQLVSSLPVVLLQSSGVKNLDTMLSQFPTHKIETADDFVWKALGSDERNIPLVEARYKGTVVGPSDTKVGEARSTIELVFGEKWFTDVQVIAGMNPDVYQFRILAEPVEDGGNYVYTVELWGGQETLLGCPGSELQPNIRFSIESAYVEDELSIKGAGIHFSSPFLMRNSVSTLRMEHKVSGAMIDYKVNPLYWAGIATRDSKTGEVKETKVWMQEVYWQFEKVLSRIKSRTLMFGKTNRAENGGYLNKGTSNIEIKAGSGIREQMEVSNTLYYNKFSIGLVEDMLYELAEGKLDFDERTFVLRTGERGAAQFSRSATKLASGWTNLTQNNPAVVQKTTSPLHSNAFKAGFQFTEWLAPNNLKIMLEVDPMYDDKIRNKKLHPDGGVAESYRYDIFSIGSMAEPNIQKIEVRGGEEIRGYFGGLRDPFMGRRGGVMSSMEDSATMTAFWQSGALVRDAGRTASLIANV